MHKQLLAVVMAFALLLPIISIRAQRAPKIIVGPDQFAFTSGTYSASAGATNAVITVHFVPGDPAYSGLVNFATQDGTARANQDYKPVSGTLYFSGVSYRSFSVPLIPQAGSQAEKSLRLVLSLNAGDLRAVILEGTALLNLNVPAPPDLRITAGTNHTISISWLNDGSVHLLEKADSPSSTWSAVSNGPTMINGRLTLIEPASAPMALYRLHRLDAEQ
jgi:hypothetical protein